MGMVSHRVPPGISPPPCPAIFSMNPNTQDTNNHEGRFNHFKPVRQVIILLFPFPDRVVSTFHFLKIVFYGQPVHSHTMLHTHF